MKFTIFLSILVIVLVGRTAVECASIDKRFLQSWLDTIHKNVLKPISDGIDKAGTSIKENVLNPISDAFQKAGESIQNNVINPMKKLVGADSDKSQKTPAPITTTTAPSSTTSTMPMCDTVPDSSTTPFTTTTTDPDTTTTTNKPTDSTTVPASSTTVTDSATETVTTIPTTTTTPLVQPATSTQTDSTTRVTTTLPGTTEPDYCSYRCRSKNRDDPTLFYFDETNGCKSKGFLNSTLNSAYDLNTCCDNHNVCLNSNCCTTNCQELKDKCNSELAECARAACMDKFVGNLNELQNCVNYASRINRVAALVKCDVTETRNRKLCIC